MPDQVRLHDPQPQNQESHLGLYGSPGSPGSDSPLSLVVRKEDQRKLQATYPVESPGRSSGFSDGSGSYESSPNRSPNHNGDSRDSDKPLSLVIRKNLVSHFQGEPPIHNKYSLHPKSNAVPPKKKWRGDEGGDDVGGNLQDSGNEGEDEDEEERALVISEQSVEEEPAVEEEENRVTEDTVFDFSTTKKTNKEVLGDDKNKEKQPTGIKIKDFARLDMPAAAPVEPKDLEPHNDPEEEVESEAESDCASVDTWSSSLAEDKLFSGTDPVIRKIRSTSSGDSVYQCDFCEKLFTNKYHLQSHLVVHTGERAFVCKTCKKTFGRKSTLRAHMTTHTKVSNFMCTVCEKACNDNNSLEEHMRMHTGIFNGQCPQPGSDCAPFQARSRLYAQSARRPTRGSRTSMCTTEFTRESGRLSASTATRTSRRRGSSTTISKQLTMELTDRSSVQTVAGNLRTRPA